MRGLCNERGTSTGSNRSLGAPSAPYISSPQRVHYSLGAAALSRYGMKRKGQRGLGAAVDEGGGDFVCLRLAFEGFDHGEGEVEGIGCALGCDEVA